MTLLGRSLLLITALATQLWLTEVSAAERKTFLWQVKGTPHYLFGTTHVPDPRVTTLPASVETALAQADVVITELKMDLETTTGAAAAMLLPNEGRLRAQLPDSTRTLLSEELGAISPLLKPAMFDRLKPWALAISLPMLGMQLKYPGVAALDVQLAQRATSTGRINEGLETLNEQLGIFDALTADQQLRLLDAALTDLRDARLQGKDNLEELILAYLSGDEQQLDQLMSKWMREAAEHGVDLGDALLDKRNHLMAERLDARWRKQPKQATFTAVGAGHLVGKNNVIDLLRKRGYTLVRVE